MMHTITTFLARMRQTLFEWRLDSEVYGSVALQIRRKKSGGYPFTSLDELAEAVSRARLDIHRDLFSIEEQGSQMPKAYGLAFRYIAYKDLSSRMQRYRRLAAARVQPRMCDPRLVATKA